eukprot:scaffold83425_cov31-Phaeocystis_antarctica.AAC.1
MPRSPIQEVRAARREAYQEAARTLRRLRGEYAARQPPPALALAAPSPPAPALAAPPPPAL